MDNPPTSTTNIHTIVRAQIVFLLSTLTEDNFERNQIEIRSVRVFFPGLYLSLNIERRLLLALGAAWNRHLPAFHSPLNRPFTIQSAQSPRFIL